MTTTTTTDIAFEAHEITLSKMAKRSLQEKVLQSNLDSILASVNTRALVVRGWKVTELKPEHYRTPWRQRFANDAKYEYRYEMYLRATFERADGQQPESHELAAICRTIATRVTQPSFGRWTLAEVDGKPWTDSVTGEDGVNADYIGYAAVEIPDDWEEHFGHLYGLDSQITRIKRALEAGELSDWNNRYHCALVGPPGCGKSDICQSIKRALGEDAVMEFDATATTSAGAIKELSEREILPRVIIIEEIEKAPETSMQFLLGVLDLRSQVRKTTARATIVRDTKMFAIATVNDVPLFEKLQAGALASRFSNTIGFQRPTREQLRMILVREVRKMEGDEAWIDPTLDYCDSKGITDPRKVTSICLCGREMLVNGEYQKLLDETTHHQEGQKL